jgi:hypothetical protein
MSGEVRIACHSTVRRFQISSRVGYGPAERNARVRDASRSRALAVALTLGSDLGSVVAPAGESLTSSEIVSLTR